MEAMFVAEGAAHAVFRAAGECGDLFRIQKGRRAAPSPRGDADLARRAVAYEAAVAAELLGAAFLPPAVLAPTADAALQTDGLGALMAALRAAYAAQGGDVEDLAIVAMRVRDATRVWRPLPCGAFLVGSPRVAIEIKPKAADGARSWCIEGRFAELKARASRLDIVRAAAEHSKTTGGAASSYSNGGVAAASKHRLSSSRHHAGSAFFSGDLAVLEAAVRGLVDDGTNGLCRGFLDGVQIADVAVLAGHSRAVAAILHREPLLANLRAAQRNFDCLDVDGVAFILALDGDAKEPEGMTDWAAMDWEAYWAEVLATPPSVVSAMHACAAPAGALSKASAAERDARREAAHAALQALAPHERRSLLRRWLISLALDDVSLMVSFAKVSPAVAERLQTAAGAGVILVDGVALAYCVAALDVGPKPTFKLKSKARAEAALCANAAALGARRPADGGTPVKAS
ncbi:hypothetical protein M885DRAFT_618548 [Pelagophyceae sp. CCMP2097]|nr:hypothetical protein M885DRAFT_618548 [Pelagophyceae sp. CCMP2097]